MNISIVLWNCNGKSQKKFPEERRKQCSEVINRWEQDGNIPTVILAQEVKSSGIIANADPPFQKLISKSEFEKFKVSERDAVCIYPKNIEEDKFPKIISLLNDFSPSIYCSILHAGPVKVLICSWHGRNLVSDKIKEGSFRSMLNFIDYIKETTDCQIVFVGGDYNIPAQRAKDILSSWRMLKGAKLYHRKEDESKKSSLKDYLIAWPSNIISERRSPQIIKPKNNVFDHDVIRHDLTLQVKGKCEGKDGEVEWKGDRGEGNIQLSSGSQVDFHFKINQNETELKNESKGKWSEKGERCITMETNEREEMKIKWNASGTGSWSCNDGVLHLECEEGSLEVEWEGRGTVKWRGETKAEWVGGKLTRWKNQMVEWTNSQKVQYEGTGEVTIDGGKLKDLSIESSEPNELRWKYKETEWRIKGSNNQEVIFDDKQITKWHGQGKITFNNDYFESPPKNENSEEVKLDNRKFEQNETDTLEWKASKGLTWNIEGNENFNVIRQDDNQILWKGKGRIGIWGRNLSDQMPFIKLTLLNDTKSKLTWQGEETITWKVNGSGTGENID